MEFFKNKTKENGFYVSKLDILDEVNTEWLEEKINRHVNDGCVVPMPSIETLEKLSKELEKDRNMGLLPKKSEIPKFT
jgi:hypothetical protein